MSSGADKWTISVYSALLAIIVFNPLTFMLTNLLFGMFNLPTYIGRSPTWFGWILHWLVFFLLARLIMEFPLPLPNGKK